MSEDDTLLGPGTDLVLSLLAVSLMLIGVVSGLYFQSVNALETAEKNTDNFECKEQSALMAKIKLLNAQKVQVQKNTPSQVATSNLKEGHDNTPVPARSSEGKQVYRIYAEGSSSQCYLYYRPYHGTKKPVSLKEAHRLLKKAKNNLGSALYVAVIVPDDFSKKAMKELQCEFWEYDYYKYRDEKYCKGLRKPSCR